MKREQLLDLIGLAPDDAVADAKHTKKRIPTAHKWLGGIAAILVIVLLFNMPAIPMIITAKAISRASEPRVMKRPHNVSSPAFDTWLEERKTRDATADRAVPAVAAFTSSCAADVLAGSDDTNRIFSPINAYIALAMTAELTAGDTQKQILDALGSDSAEHLRTDITALWEQVYENDGNEICVLANSLWLDRDVDYVAEPMEILAHDYYASVYQGNLGSTRTNRDMTNWMRNQTGGFLTDRTGNVSIAPEDQLLTLASTIHFRSKWNHEFDAQNNTEAMFHTHSGDVLCTFMNKKEAHMNYHWAEDWGAVQLYLENGSSMWFILPDEDKTVDDILDDPAYMEMISQDEYAAGEGQNRRYMKVNLSVPQFDVKASTDLKTALQSMGLTDIFDPYRGDFSPSIISDPERPPYLDSIHQDVRVRIDEQGVAAAAYIELNFGAGAAAPPDEIIDFVLDRPFVFAVSKSSIPLFVGTVNHP